MRLNHNPVNALEADYLSLRFLHLKVPLRIPDRFDHPVLIIVFQYDDYLEFSLPLSRRVLLAKVLLQPECPNLLRKNIMIVRHTDVIHLLVSYALHCTLKGYLNGILYVNVII